MPQWGFSHRVKDCPSTPKPPPPPLFGRLPVGHVRLSALLGLFHFVLATTCEVDTVVHPILQMGKEVQWPVHSYTAGAWLQSLWGSLLR